MHQQSIGRFLSAPNNRIFTRWQNDWTK